MNNLHWSREENGSNKILTIKDLKELINNYENKDLVVFYGYKGAEFVCEVNPFNKEINGEKTRCLMLCPRLKWKVLEKD